MHTEEEEGEKGMVWPSNPRLCHGISKKPLLVENYEAPQAQRLFSSQSKKKRDVAEKVETER